MGEKNAEGEQSISATQVSPKGKCTHEVPTSTPPSSGDSTRRTPLFATTPTNSGDSAKGSASIVGLQFMDGVDFIGNTPADMTLEPTMQQATANLHVEAEGISEDEPSQLLLVSPQQPKQSAIKRHRVAGVAASSNGHGDGQPQHLKRSRRVLSLGLLVPAPLEDTADGLPGSAAVVSIPATQPAVTTPLTPARLLPERRDVRSPPFGPAPAQRVPAATPVAKATYCRERRHWVTPRPTATLSTALAVVAGSLDGGRKGRRRTPMRPSARAAADRRLQDIERQAWVASGHTVADFCRLYWLSYVCALPFCAPQFTRRWARSLHCVA